MTANTSKELSYYYFRPLDGDIAPNTAKQRSTCRVHLIHDSNLNVYRALDNFYALLFTHQKQERQSSVELQVQFPGTFSTPCNKCFVTNFGTRMCKSEWYRNTKHAGVRITHSVKCYLEIVNLKMGVLLGTASMRKLLHYASLSPSTVTCQTSCCTDAFARSDWLYNFTEDLHDALHIPPRHRGFWLFY